MPPTRRSRSRLSALGVDLTPIRESRDFRLLWTGQIISTLGRQMTVVALPFQVYSLTGSSLAVGFLGLAQVLPLIAVSLVGGPLADRFDRRRLLLQTQLGLGAMSFLLVLGAVAGHPSLAYIYAVVAVRAAVSGIDAPTRSAIIPNVVSPAALPSAIALNMAAFQSMTILGPAVGGLLVARFGVTTAYAIDAASFGAALAAAWMLSPQPPLGEVHEPPVVAIRRGLSFARRQRAIIGGFAIDLSAMVFGMPRAVFPALAANTFHTNAFGLGLLYAAVGLGSVVASLTAGWVRHVAAQGRLIVTSVALWGVAIIGVGLVHELVAALVLLAVAGAADSISAVCRMTMLQTLTPDDLRGRLNALYFMVVVGGPYLGDLEAGALGYAVSSEFSVISGGALCLLGLAASALAFPAVWRYRAGDTAVGAAPANVTAEVASEETALPR